MHDSDSDSTGAGNRPFLLRGGDMNEISAEVWIGNRPFYLRGKMMHNPICPKCKSEDTKMIWFAPAFRLCDKCHVESQAIPVTCKSLPDESDDRIENVCTNCGGLNRESVGGFEWDCPVRCSVCNLVQPGFRVNRCLRKVINADA